MVDEEGHGKFSYLTTRRGTPYSHPSLAGMFAMSVDIPASIQQAKLRAMSLFGDKSACTILELRCVTGTATSVVSTSSQPLLSGGGGRHSVGLASALTGPSNEPLVGLEQQNNAGEALQQPLTQTAQIRQLLRHVAQPEGGRAPALKLPLILRISISPIFLRQCTCMSTGKDKALITWSGVCLQHYLSEAVCLFARPCA